MQKLLYISRADAVFKDKHQLLTIAQVASKRNQENGVKGILFYSNGYFLQLLEGPKAKVNETYVRIKADTRHSDIQLIPIVEEDTKPIFGDWSMSSNWVELKDDPHKMDARIRHFKEVVTQNKLSSAFDLLEAFFTPQKNTLNDFFKQKTVIVSDSYVKCASFMNWIATTENVERNRLHFTPVGNQNDEQILDYIDFHRDNQSHRIIGVETSALGQPSLLPLLSKTTRLILLVSRDHAVTEASIKTLSAIHRSLLHHSPQVYCMFSTKTEDQKQYLKSALGSIDINPILPNLHTNDFREIWELILQKPEIAESLVEDESARAPYPEEKTRLHAVATGKQSSLTKPVLTSSQQPAPPSAQAVVVNPITIGEIDMSSIKDGLTELMQVDGALGAFVADYSSGMLLAKEGGGIDLDIAAAGNTEVIKAKMKTIASLGLKDAIEDILITLGKQYHIIRPLSSKQGLFLYLVLDKAKSNLAMARFKLLDIEKTMEV